jgi:hypothetical protein
MRGILIAVLHALKKRHPEPEQHFKWVLNQLSLDLKQNPFNLLFLTILAEHYLAAFCRGSSDFKRREEFIFFYSPVFPPETNRLHFARLFTVISH